MGLGKIGLILK